MSGAITPPSCALIKTPSAVMYSANATRGCHSCFSTWLQKPERVITCHQHFSPSHLLSNGTQYTLSVTNGIRYLNRRRIFQRLPPLDRRDFCVLASATGSGGAAVKDTVLYDNLGVASSAEKMEIKRAFRRLAIQVGAQ